MKRLALVPVIALLALAGGAAAEPIPPPDPVLCTITQGADGVVPYGAQRTAIGAALGVDCQRNAVSTLTWTGSDAGVEAIRNAGFKLNLNIRSQPPPSGGVAQPSIPPRTPAELAQFKATTAEILQTYQPELVTVENEEDSPKFFSGTVEEYLRELRAAIHVARPMGLPVSNGGITALPTMLMTWQHIRNTKGQGAADDFVRRTLGQTDGRAVWQRVLADLLARPYAGVADVPTLQEHWDFARALVRAYHRSRLHPYRRDPQHAAVDFVNFHWYFKDPRALGQAINFLHVKTHRPLVTTEIGQYDREPSTVTGLLRRAFAGHLRWLVWFDGDGDPAQALHNGDGTLRVNGQAFRAFADARRHG